LNGLDSLNEKIVNIKEAMEWCLHIQTSGDIVLYSISSGGASGGVFFAQSP
jgi:hypothetical protein